MTPRPAARPPRPPEADHGGHGAPDRCGGGMPGQDGHEASVPGGHGTPDHAGRGAPDHDGHEVPVRCGREAPVRCGREATWHDSAGRRTALFGLVLLIPAALLVALLLAGLRMTHDHCSADGCTRTLTALTPWLFRSLWASAALGTVALLLPGPGPHIDTARRLAAAAQVLLLAAPFAVLPAA